MDSIFEFFFKYRPLLYQEGDFRFLSPWPLPLTRNRLSPTKRRLLPSSRKSD